MPQSNPVPVNSKSKTFSFTLDSSEYIVGGSVGNYHIQKTVEIPEPFTSILWVHHIRAHESSAQTNMYIYCELAPGEDVFTSIGESTAWPIAVGGANYPIMFMAGLGPAFRGTENTNGKAGLNQP